MEPSREQRYMRNPSALSTWRARAAGTGGGSATARDMEETEWGQTGLMLALRIPKLMGTAAARVRGTERCCRAVTLDRWAVDPKADACTPWVVNLLHQNGPGTNQIKGNCTQITPW